MVDSAIAELYINYVQFCKNNNSAIEIGQKFCMVKTISTIYGTIKYRFHLKK